ncbi:MAG: hypothetical protein Q8P54_03160 [bacterium]|nr:hypothetical protein [bacterium]
MVGGASSIVSWSEVLGDFLKSREGSLSSISDTETSLPGGRQVQHDTGQVKDDEKSKKI